MDILCGEDETMSYEKHTKEELINQVRDLQLELLKMKKELLHNPTYFLAKTRTYSIKKHYILSIPRIYTEAHNIKKGETYRITMIKEE